MKRLFPLLAVLFFGCGKPADKPKADNPLPDVPPEVKPIQQAELPKVKPKAPEAPPPEEVKPQLPKKGADEDEEAIYAAAVASAEKEAKEINDANEKAYRAKVEKQEADFQVVKDKYDVDFAEYGLKLAEYRPKKQEYDAANLLLQALPPKKASKGLIAVARNKYEGIISLYPKTLGAKKAKQLLAGEITPEDVASFELPKVPPKPQEPRLPVAPKPPQRPALVEHIKIPSPAETRAAAAGYQQFDEKDKGRLILNWVEEYKAISKGIQDDKARLHKATAPAEIAKLEDYIAKYEDKLKKHIRNNPPFIRQDDPIAIAAKRAEEEIDFNGLILLKKSVSGSYDQISTKITGIVENRTGKSLRYVQITYGILDEDGNRVGTALANIAGLEAGERWSFRAVALGKGTQFRLIELVGR